MPRRPSTTLATKPTATPTATEEHTKEELMKRPIDQLIKEYGRFPLHYQITILINEAINKSWRPHLTGKLSYCEYVEGDILKHAVDVDGDYICYSILRICEILRSNDPAFRNLSSLNIAKFILLNLRKSDTSHMLQESKLVDVGYLSFKLNGDFIAEILRKNLIDGASAWAPILPVRKVVVDFPEQATDAERRADCVRATYIKDLLVHMLEFSGVQVCNKTRNEQSLQIVKKAFPEEGDIIKDKKTSLFLRKGKATSKSQPNNVHEDIAALWCGGLVQKASWIIYVTPVRQREYILKCFDAARVFVKEDKTSIRYLGYQTSSNEKEKMDLVWSMNFNGPFLQEALHMARNFGYISDDSGFECMMRYHYLKTYTYSDCTFEGVEMFGKEGNNFVRLLETRIQIRRVLENSHPNLESKKALVGEEREFGLHLLRFTKIVEETVMNLTPHSLCDYLYNLSKNFTNFMSKTQHTETLVLLCKAAEVVFSQSFDLLGINSDSSNVFFKLQPFTNDHTSAATLKPVLRLETGEPMTRDHYIALPVLSPNLSSRIEIFSMSIGVDFEDANLFGEIRVSDTYGVHPHKWCDTDLNGHGKVAYLTKRWYDPMVIPNSSLFPLPLGDPASCVSVPFSDSIKIEALLWVSCKEKKVVYQLCNVDGDKGEIRLEEFWRSKQKIKRSVFSVEGVNGCLRLYYFLLKEVVDTKISLTYESIVGNSKVRGQIHAYYGDGALKKCHSYDKVFYKALIYGTGPSKLDEGHLKMNKSTLAVPKKGVLVIESFFVDVDKGKTIIEETHEFREECEGEKSKVIIGGENCHCRFILRVDWIRGRH